MPVTQFNSGIFWSVLGALLVALSIWGFWWAATSAIRRRRAEIRDPNYLIDRAFQGKNAFKPARPLSECSSIEDLKREYTALRDAERAASRTLAINTRGDAQASREQIIDAAVNAFTAGGMSQEEMDEMINEANRRQSKPPSAPATKLKDGPPSCV